MRITKKWPSAAFVLQKVIWLEMGCLFADKHLNDFTDISAVIVAVGVITQQ